MTSLTDTQVITASGGLVELGYGEITSGVTVTSTATDGQVVIPAITVVCDGSPVLVEYFSNQVRADTTANCEMQIYLMQDGSNAGVIGRAYNAEGGFDNKDASGSFRTTPSAGSHTFGINAKVSAGTGYFGAGSGGSATDELPAFIRVSKIVQATQWPAVTTSTIICTSSTRPASPFEGQKIYETDTNRELTYDSGAWVQTVDVGEWSSWTPQLWQSSNVSSTITNARYTRIGQTAIVHARCNITSSGSAGTQMEVRNLPFSCREANLYTIMGHGAYWDGSYRWLLMSETLPTATSVAFAYDSAPFSAYGGSRFGASPSKAMASGHFLEFNLTYEIA